MYRAILCVAALLTSGIATPPAASQSILQPIAADQAARDLLAGAQARLAFNLIEKVASGPAQQATVSPASLASVLDLVSIGAAPKMKAALAKALGFTDQPDAGLALSRTRAASSPRAATPSPSPTRSYLRRRVCRARSY
jgi:serine protease inhibitor